MRVTYRSLLAALVAFAALNTEAAPSKAPYAANKGYKKLIKKNHRAFDACGDAERARSKKTLKGVVLMKFTVNGDGKVTDWGPVHNTTKSRALADCLGRALEQLPFPATFGAPVTGSYPFKFKAKK